MIHYSRYGNKYGGKVKAGLVINPVVTKPHRRVPSTGPVKAEFVPDEGTAPPTKVYTGDAMLGIGTMHKSNAVPVFSTDDAKDLATMRRG